MAEKINKIERKNKGQIQIFSQGMKNSLLSIDWHKDKTLTYLDPLPPGVFREIGRGPFSLSRDIPHIYPHIYRL